MKRIIICTLFITILFSYRPSEAAFISIENIGDYPIVWTMMQFDVGPSLSGHPEFYIYSEGNMFAINPELLGSPYVLILPISWDQPIGVGQTYVSSSIPQLDGADFWFLNGAIATPGATISGRTGPNEPELDFTRYTYTTDHFGKRFGATIVFHSGEPTTVPEPSVLLLFIIGFIGFVFFVKKKSGFHI